MIETNRISLKKSKVINLRRFFLVYFILVPLFIFQQGFTKNLEKENVNQSHPNVHYVYSNNESKDRNGVWDIENATFSGNRITTSVSNARGTEFKTDGTKMYILGRSSQTIFEFELSNSWDIASVTLVQELDISSEMGNGVGNDDSTPHGLFINKENGKDVYVFNRREVWQYELSTPWDISSASQIKYKDLSDVVIRGHDIHFKPDGTKFYVEDRFNRMVYQYSLSSPWNIESLNLEYSLDISEQEEAVRGIEIKPDGTRMYLMDTDRKEVLQYELDIPWEIESANFETTFDVSSQTENPRSITWKPDGSTFFVTHSNNGTVFQYNVATDDSGSEKDESNEDDNSDNTDESEEKDPDPDPDPDNEEDVLKAPNQSSPNDNENFVSQVLTFKWYSVQDAEYYILHVSGKNPSEMVIDLAVSDTTYTVDEPLISDRVHHWRVRAVKDGIQGEWSDIWEFTTTTDTNSNEEASDEEESDGREEDNGGDNKDESSDSNTDSDEGDNGSSDDKNDAEDEKGGENENEDDNEESESGEAKDNEETEQHENLKSEKNVVLDQNYPNPFNPSTVIRFYLPEAQQVSLKIYNIAGQEAATLVNGNLLSGTQTITFFADGLSSGIYFYRLITENQVITRKMTLIK